MNLTIETELQFFPSENTHANQPLKDRMKSIKDVRDACCGIVREALQKAGVKRWTLTKDKPLYNRVAIRFTFFYDDLRRRDIHNHRIKQFLDALTLCHVIPDDDYKSIPEVHFVFGGHAAKSKVVVQIMEEKEEKTAA